MANQTLQNLKKIHDLQKVGEISQLLKEIKNSKVQVESLSNKIIEKRKELLAKIERQNQEVKKETVENVVPSENANKQQGKDIQYDNKRVFDNKQQVNNRNNAQNRPFDKNKPFNKDRKDFAKSNQPQNKNFGKKTGTGFISAKANNFRSFANDLPEIDFKNERSHANKAKFAQKYSNNDERKSQNRRKDEQRKNNVFIEDENGFE